MSRRHIGPSRAHPSPRSSRRGLPWGKFLLLGFLLLLAAAWFAPLVAMKTGFRARILQAAAADFPGTIAATTGSAGWLSPVELQGISAFDGQGQEVLRVARVATEKNLFSLLLDPRDVGKIRIEQPQLKLELRPDGSNVEDLLKPWLEKESTSPPVGFAVEVVDGQVEVVQAGGAPWRLDQLQCSFKLPHDRSTVAAQLKTAIVSQQAAPGSLSAELQWQTANSSSTPAAGPSQGIVHFQSSACPLDIAAVGLRRVGIDAQMTGSLTADVELTVAEKNQIAKIKQLDVQNLQLASAAWLGPDRVQLARLVGTGEVTRSTSDWQVRNLALQSDIGELQISGMGPVDANAATIANQLAGAVRRGNWEMRSSLDVAKAAAMLPTTLRLREGTHVSSGLLAASLVSQSLPDGGSWNAQIQATDLAAVHAGQSHQWKQPIVLTAAVKETAAGIVLENLVCDSTFLKLAGRGTLAQGTLTVSGDLSQFVNEIGRFVDLGSIRAAGSINGQVDWQSGTNQAVTLAGKAAAQNFELTYAADRPWREKQLDVTFAANAKVADGKLAAIEGGSVQVIAAGDRLDAQLLQPVPQPSAQSVWPCRVQVRGSLAQWLARGQMLFSVEPWQITGDNLELAGDVRMSLARVEWEGATGRVSNLVAAKPGLRIREPEVEIQSTAAYDLQRNEFTTPATTVASSTIALRAEKTNILIADDQVAMAGVIQYRTDLERLLGLFSDETTPPSYRLLGEATGQVQLAYDQGATRVDGTMSVERFEWQQPARSTGLSIVPVNQASPWKTVWNEPRLEITAAGQLDASGSELAIQKLQVAGDSLSLGAAGAVRDLRGRCVLDVAGQYAYDLEGLAARLRTTLGPQIRMVGTGQREFAVRGPIFAATQPSSPLRPASTASSAPGGFAGLAEMLAETSIGWQQLNVQGIEIGAGEIATKLQQGQLQISPINLPVSEGKIAIAPTIDVTRTPYIATVQPGTVVDQVRITPQMCRSWLKYLAPLMADATAAEGHFSVSIDEAQFPVSDPLGGNVEGKFIVHAAQIGPGPLSQELLTLVNQVRAIVERQPQNAVTATPTAQWLDVPQQQLNFQLADHKVYHRDMQMLVKDIAIKTSGWVGLDQQIALVAEVPVRDEWVAKDRYLASLKGQVIRLPINGSLTRPQVDRTALQQLTRQTVINAGSNLLQEELNKGLERGLNKLFQPRAPAPAPAPQP